MAKKKSKEDFKIKYTYLNKPESKERLRKAYTLCGLTEENLLKFLNKPEKDKKPKDKKSKGRAK